MRAQQRVKCIAAPLYRILAYYACCKIMLVCVKVLHNFSALYIYIYIYICDCDVFGSYRTCVTNIQACELVLHVMRGQHVVTVIKNMLLSVFASKLILCCLERNSNALHDRACIACYIIWALRIYSLCTHASLLYIIMRAKQVVICIATVYFRT